MAIAERPLIRRELRDGKQLLDHIADLDAVRVEGDTIVFNPEAMLINKYYFATLNKEPFLYRRVSETEVEVYGLAEEPFTSTD